MSSSIVYSRKTCILSHSSRTPMHRVLAVNRIEKSRIVQSRSLWWWGRNGTWSSANEHDNVEERLRRQQKIMSYRYSRALRRRATWDRDNSPPTWLWRGPTRIPGRRWGCKPLSTSEHMQAKLKEEESGIPRQDKPWEEFHRDFESFKVAVDKAIEKDPYGYLFGRRLRSPSADSGSIWAPFTRIFNQQENKRQDLTEKEPARSTIKIKIENLDKSKNTCKSESHKDVPASSSQADNTLASKTRPIEEYVYDPISGRKVLKMQGESQEPSQPKRPFLETLFAEHGADEAIANPKSVPTVTKADAKVDKKAFENSRTREYLQLRASTIGTSIDTTVAFGGKYQSEAETEEEIPNKRIQKSAEPEEDAPLYSGTVYDTLHTSQNLSQPETSKTKSTWLQQEGFKQLPIQGTLSNVPPRNNGSDRLQPAFDRMSTNHEHQSETKYVTKLQPALDRMEAPRTSREAKIPKPAPLNITASISVEKPQPSKVSGRSQNSPELDRREDLDLLRASDVRAATKVARVTKQEVDQAKNEARSKLEADYISRQKAAEASSDVDSARMAIRSTKTATSVTSVLKHVQRYPDGIVAKTMKSMGVLNENFKKYQKPYGDRVDLTEKLELSPEALEKLPSIYKDVQHNSRASIIIAPSAEALKVEKAKAEISRAIKIEKQEMLDRQEKENNQIENLAHALKQLYQNHTDLTESSPVIELPAVKAPAQDCKDVIKRPVHPLQTATVRPGVQRYPEIERYTQEFEPKLINIHEKLKAVSKNTAELRMAMVNLSSEKACSKAPERSAAVSNAHEEQESSESRQIASSVISATSSNDAGVIATGQSQPSTTPITDDKAKAGKRSEEIKTEGITPEVVSHNPEKVSTSPIVSPYVLLTYNFSTKEVDLTQLNNLMGTWEETNKVNPISVMSDLNHAAAFVMRFAELERTGYTLLGGGGDILIFRNQNIQTTPQKDNKEALESIKSIKSVISEIRNRIAAEETRSQPVFPPKSTRTPMPTPTHTPKQSATVLDGIPASVPDPVPQTPTTPSSSPPKTSKKKTKDNHKVQRQEQVFSGTIRPNAASKPDVDSASASKPDSSGFFTRLYRTIKRVTLTIGALGGVAYAIGVVSEGLGAHAQHQRAIGNGTSDEGHGPRKKVVVTHTPTTRPGFFSTESTRD